jgi:hypothetical protein
MHLSFEIGSYNKKKFSSFELTNFVCKQALTKSYFSYRLSGLNRKLLAIQRFVYVFSFKQITLSYPQGFFFSALFQIAHTFNKPHNLRRFL